MATICYPVLEVFETFCAHFSPFLGNSASKIMDDNLMSSVGLLHRQDQQD